MDTVKIKVKKKRPFLLLLLAVGMIGLALTSVAWVGISHRYQAQSLRQDTPVMLQVPPLVQAQGTSCGEAVIVMTYNYIYSETPLSEAEVIAYATENGYFTEETEPFTSPSNMRNIARHYVDDHTSGNVLSESQGLALLIRNLQKGDPVIIDVLTHFDDPTSSAHFVLVTGIARDVNDPTLITVYFNNPLTGLNESAPWQGDTGVWHAWQNNPDPGGKGWWMVISPH